MNEVIIQSDGIKRALAIIKPIDSILEYIWNGFDAKAKQVKISFEQDELEKICTLSISDDGYGINRNELDVKFSPLFNSEKQLEKKVHKKQSAVHGKNGYGRLTFFKFCNIALWETRYSVDDIVFEYTLRVESDDLTKYDPSSEEVASSDKSGTKVTFSEFIEPIYIETLKDTIIREFVWFIYLNREKGYEIILNDEVISFDSMIGENEKLNPITLNGNIFEVEYVRWNQKPGSEYSNFYFMNSSFDEVHKETTLFNKKGDSFHHSLYIKSSYFDEFDVPQIGANEDQTSLFLNTQHDKEYGQLKTTLNDFLGMKRKPFLKKTSEKVIMQFKKDQAFPKFNTKNSWEKIQLEELENLISELYQVEPKIFSNLNKTQKKTFTYLLNMIMDSGERDHLFNILGQITELSSDEREEFSNILQRTSLSAVIKTIKLLENRVVAINQLQELVYNKTLKANERDHLQKFIESHYWIFGEQYSVAAAAEDKFNKVLKQYHDILLKDDELIDVTHKSKNREMDILLVRQDIHYEKVSNIVVELKAPWISLGKNQYDQVYEYMNVISSHSQFNAPNTKWVFILVGNKFNTSGFIEDQLENAKNHGIQSLVFKKSNIEVYAKTWAEIINDFEIRHKFLLSKLELKREKLYEQYNTAEEIILESEKITAQ